MQLFSDIVIQLLVETIKYNEKSGFSFIKNRMGSHFSAPVVCKSMFYSLLRKIPDTIHYHFPYNFNSAFFTIFST
ncbi:hypothetical protein AB28_1602 [Raoultella ornithinolytica 2-156-04_S1_C2]|nr:hypothetical protein AB00_1589 [Raoultella ornithinolytica 2-156-04_S1_C1]KDX15501.1 hypothetical protein AB28_1602 [Raoultella ornithinolytica 2-156-04_S1_C2]